MPIVAVVVVAVVGVACDKLQKITWYIVNNNKYIAQPDNSTPGTPLPRCQGVPRELWTGKLHVVFQHQQRHQQRLIPTNENLYKFEKSDNILLLLAIKTT